jgi:hypothetical protein
MLITFQPLEIRLNIYNTVTYFSVITRPEPHSGMSSHCTKKAEFPSRHTCHSHNGNPRFLELDAITIRKRLYELIKTDCLKYGRYCTNGRILISVYLFTQSTRQIIQHIFFNFVITM